MDQIATIKTKPGGYMESQSGLQRSNPTIYGRLRGTASRDLAFVVVHPTSNFFGHYLLEPVATRNASLLALNTRYVGNDSMLMMERAIQDVGAGVNYLRQLGFRQIVLIGNSGGGSLASFYQQQATALTVSTTADGEPIDLTPDDLPGVDGLALVAAHTGRSDQLLAKIDPSLSAEAPDAPVDPSLDMFEPQIGPPYDAAWLQRYRTEQERRLRRITDSVLVRLEALRNERPVETADEGLLIHRTQADPRNLDLSLDANDRSVGTLGGEARAYNMAANGLARFCTLRSFLSQWSPWHTRAHGPTCLSCVTVPKLIIDHTADQTVFPSQVAAWRMAAGPDSSYVPIQSGTHYLAGQPQLVAKVADTLVDWGRSLP